MGDGGADEMLGSICELICSDIIKEVEGPS